MNEHPISRYAIAGIRREDLSNRFLVFYRKSWGCFQFPYYATEGGTEWPLLKGLSHDFDVSLQSIVFWKRGQEMVRKYSPKAGKEKRYFHEFYGVYWYYSEEMRQDTFVRNGREYRWMTLEELDDDPATRKYNFDVIEAMYRYVW